MVGGDKLKALQELKHIHARVVAKLLGQAADLPVPIYGKSSEEPSRQGGKQALDQNQPWGLTDRQMGRIRLSDSTVSACPINRQTDAAAESNS